MNIQRRDFLKMSLATAATAALSPRVATAAEGAGATGAREYYDLREYRLKPGTSHANLDTYLEKALIPALEKRGIKNVGAFTELDVDKKAATSKPKADSSVWLLIPHPSFESYVSVAAEINADPDVQKSGAAYLEAPKSSPAFERIDAWLLLAFKSAPALQLPAFSKSRTPTRVFEMRDYESHSELKALNKARMFNEGEIGIMKDIGVSPVFFGQAIAGRDLPHLRYMTSGPDLKTHLDNWKKFGPDPRWAKLKDDPQYAQNTSKNTARFLAPKPYSVI